MGKKSKQLASGIFCTAHYVPVGKGAAAWKAGTEQGNGNHDQTAEHAERKAYAEVSSTQGAKTFCLVTNDFPCQYCVTFFLVESVAQKRHFVLRATSNGGGYAAECGFRGNTDGDRFDKSLSGDLYITDGKAYAAGRVITVSNLPAKFTDKHGSNTAGVSIVKIESAAAQGNLAVPAPAVFTGLATLPG